MSKAWLFTVEVTGFPRTDRIEPIEVYGGHYERWVVMAESKDLAEAIISNRIYYLNRLERELSPDEIDGLRLLPNTPRNLDGWRGVEGFNGQ